MATRYTDDSFSEIRPLHEALNLFYEALESGTAKSFHVGNENDISNQIAELDFSKRLSEIETEIAKIKVTNSTIIKKPTFEEIKVFSNT